jgi:hypothetical protein
MGGAMCCYVPTYAGHLASPTIPSSIEACQRSQPRPISAKVACTIITTQAFSSNYCILLCISLKPQTPHKACVWVLGSVNGNYLSPLPHLPAYLVLGGQYRPVPL